MPDTYSTYERLCSDIYDRYPIIDFLAVCVCSDLKYEVLSHPKVVSYIQRIDSNLLIFMGAYLCWDKDQFEEWIFFDNRERLRDHLNRFEVDYLTACSSKLFCRKIKQSFSCSQVDWAEWGENVWYYIHYGEHLFSLSIRKKSLTLNPVLVCQHTLKLINTRINEIKQQHTTKLTSN